MTTALKIAYGSLIVGIMVLGIKMLAWWMTGSVALFSDALESTVNVATAIAVLLAVNYAQKPADDGHPFGHYKAEYFSAVLEGVMIVIAAIVILQAAWHALSDPADLSAPWAGLAVNLVASLINGGWCFLLLRKGRALRSPALVADGRHLLTDVVSSVGVAIGLVAVAVTGVHWLDPLLDRKAHV